jgi:hypothetical protein
MPRKVGLTHVRSFIEHIDRLATYMLDEQAKQRKDGLRLPPIFESELRQTRLIARAIINKDAKARAKSGQRKDIRLEA